MKRRTLTFDLTDEEAATYDAVRSLWPDHPVLRERLSGELTGFLRLAARDSLVKARIAETGSRLRRRRLRSVS